MAQTKIKPRQLEGGLDGWIPAGETWTYASATTITVPSGAASKYQKGDKIKLTQTTVKYFYIVGVADTLLTVTGGSDYSVANAAITSPFYSHIENPQGFPEFFAVTAPTFSSSGAGFTNQPTLYMTFSAGQIPTSFVGYTSGVFLNMSTAKNGFLVFEDNVTTMRFYAYDGTTPFTNNDYFGLSGWYPYAA